MKNIITDPAIIQATDPAVNLTVHASAGTGKTWLLTSRIVRLLLSGATPNSILAITFTRKAANEIQERVHERLLHMATTDDGGLDHSLLEIGVTPSTEIKQLARSLYESLLRTEYPLRATTFHAFCQEILHRFPLEAGIMPNFELAEQTGELRANAWKRLRNQLLDQPNGNLAKSVDTLLIGCNGLSNFRDALNNFFDHRSDWWAYTEHFQDPVAEATMLLEKKLGKTLSDNPSSRVYQDELLKKRVYRYATLLSLHGSKTYRSLATQAISALEQGDETNTATTFERLLSVLFTQHGSPRQMNHTKALETSLGQSQCQELLELHVQLQDIFIAIKEEVNRYHTLSLSSAWYYCGNQLLAHYQDIKQEMGVLDFTDLEWNAYLLLTQSDHAQWIQYKLDQRINHLLIDEFQDTNPTQWQLLLPLLQEMAAGSSDRQRSVFLVGDEKQSIYGFRRADPRLFNTAHDWLASHLQANSHKQHKSRRSSAAITNFVNLVFTESESLPTPILRDFPTHDTHHDSLWGRVELLPLVESGETELLVNCSGYRDPLTMPRITATDARYEKEATLIVERIKSLIGQPIHDQSGYRPTRYSDILILVRDRKPIQYYESALQQAGIPFSGASRSSFLDYLEVRDMINLLQSLSAPYDNLALASVLRSPVFSCSDQDLQFLAQFHDEIPDWLERLNLLSDKTHAHLLRAQRYLSKWRQQADRIPVHDLLDQIFNDADVMARYQASSPENRKTQVVANLGHFLQLALDVDSGRYPSLSRFLFWLKASTKGEQEAPSEPVITAEEKVRIMTIHAAKGLESPVVFLADTARAFRVDRGYRALINWPAEDRRPNTFHFIGKKESLDIVSNTTLEQEKSSKEREEHNLLYVALTRAKQLLIISGCAPRKGSDLGWYGYIAARVPESTHLFEHGEIQVPVDLPGTHTQVQESIMERELMQRMDLPSSHTLLNPSLQAQEDVKPKEQADYSFAKHKASAKLRGTAIHRMLEVLSVSNNSDNVEQLRRELSNSLSARLFDNYLNEVLSILSDPQLKEIFDRSRYDAAYNELPILYYSAEQPVYGIIDRIVVQENVVTLIDYKTHSKASPETVNDIANDYKSQMKWYAQGAAKLWPGKTIRTLLLFTACRTPVEITPESGNTSI
ncbi:MAG: UvrD-helicase domain-containing protein [Gammaproteobacteria bacterium]|nr:UvrD-helicase domain-containing protein [Gammaproteobacteria bacterium]